MIWLFGVLVVLWLAINFAVVLIATRPPRTPAISSPGAIGAPQEIVTIKSHDLIELSGWWVQGDHPTSVAVLCHGFFLSKGELAPIAYMLWKQGISCLLFDFRGHGKSIGGTCSFGYHEKDDVQAAVEWVRRRNRDARIVLIGSSMGSVASALAWAEDPDLADALVLDSAYSNLGKAVNGWWRFIGGPWLSILLWPAALIGVLFLGFSPFTIKVPYYLEQLRGRPMLFMHGTDDLVAPAKSAGKNLYAMGPGVEAIWFPDCGHSEGRWEQPETYRSALLRFLEKNGFIEAKDREISAD
ncbi:MAG: alpha/beta fold hydrolase [Chlorobia bacterium]|nr:alpha/beta fold hydrolase [Fimbriimonadaceae bacterium]